MQSRLLLLVLAAVVFPALVRAQGGSPADEKAIRDIETQWEAAWNHHDVPAMVRLVAPDSDVVNLAGEWFKGRDAFAKSLEALHSGKVKESVWKTEQADVKFLTPTIAVVHVYFDTHGELNPDGSPMPPRRGIYTRVEVKRGGQWLIVATQATNIVSRASAVMIDAPHRHIGQ
jgi:uncharacterized protein (TIGR02246 family)